MQVLGERANQQRGRCRDDGRPEQGRDPHRDAEQEAACRQAAPASATEAKGLAVITSSMLEWSRDARSARIRAPSDGAMAAMVITDR